MRLIIDIPDMQYNNIMEFKSICLGRIPYKGIIINAIKGIKNGTPIPDDATVCDIEQIRQEIESNMEDIKGHYSNTTPIRDMPSPKIYRNEGRQECLDIIDNHIKGESEC